MTADFVEPPDDDRLPDDVQQEIDAALQADQAAGWEIRFNELVATRVRDLQITQEARRRLAKQERADLERPKLVRLDHLLARQYDTPTYRIQNLWPTGGRMLLAAQWKAGKSTLVGNLIRALVDGDQFLGRYLPRQAGRVVLIDDELDERTLQLWFREQHIDNADAVDLLPLRGRVAAFDILDPDSRAEWAKDLAGADVVVLDCLRPIFDAFGLDENHEAGRFLVALDALLADAGVDECGVVHHMGHAAERSRGDSRLLDWPDALWKIVRDKDDEDEAGHADDPQGSRYFSAYGRDVDVAQAELLYDRATRRLEIGSKTRHQATEDRKERKAEEAVLAVVTADPGVNKNGVRKGVRKHGVKHQPLCDAAVESLVEDGLIVRQIRGQSHLHYPTDHPGATARVSGYALETTETNRDQPALVSVNDGLTSGNSEPRPTETTPTGPGVRNRPRPTETEPRPGLSGEIPRPETFRGSGRYLDPQSATETETTGPGLGSKPCPECGHNLIPANYTRCPECADRLVHEAMPGD